MCNYITLTFIVTLHGSQTNGQKRCRLLFREETDNPSSWTCHLQMSTRQRCDISYIIRSLNNHLTTHTHTHTHGSLQINTPFTFLTFIMATALTIHHHPTSRSLLFIRHHRPPVNQAERYENCHSTQVNPTHNLMWALFLMTSRPITNLSSHSPTNCHFIRLRNWVDLSYLASVLVTLRTYSWGETA